MKIHIPFALPSIWHAWYFAMFEELAAEEEWWLRWYVSTV